MLPLVFDLILIKNLNNLCDENKTIFVNTKIISHTGIHQQNTLLHSIITWFCFEEFKLIVNFEPNNEPHV